jgi:hypothetical protein
VAVALGLGVLGGTALADPAIRPPITVAQKPQSFALVVPDEYQPKATLTMVELYPPPELAIKSFSETDGWKRDWTIVSRDVTVQKATWTRASGISNDPFYASDPTPSRKQEQATVRFRFVAVPSAKTSYPVEVRETYSNGR